MDNKIMSIRFNEFDLEFLALLKQHVNREGIQLNDSQVVKYAVKRLLLLESLDLGTDSELYQVYKKVDSAYTKHLLES